MGESAQDFSSCTQQGVASIDIRQQSATTNASNKCNIIIYLRTKTPAGEMFDMVLAMCTLSLMVIKLFSIPLSL